jgi:nitroreductase
MAAARALGLGVVPIGGIRQDSQGMIDLLGLPPLSMVSKTSDSAPNTPFA